MKTFLLTLLLLTSCIKGQAQFVTCESMPLDYDDADIHFATSVGSGDSMLVIPITNTSSTNFAYPQAKIIPVGLLPFGTTMYDYNWHVFFSSWNSGVTGYPVFYFNVSSPVPADYTCKFILMVTNFPPLSIDSCYFADTVEVNLNPTGTSIGEITKTENVFDLYPNPASESVNIITNVPASSVFLYDMNGRVLATFFQSDRIDLRPFRKGIYLIRCLETGQVRKLVKE